MATERELLAARIFFRAVFPVIRVLIEDDPRMRARFRGVNATVQIVARDGDGRIGAYLRFADGHFEVVNEIAPNPDITLAFGSVAKMNAMFAGKPVVPRIKGIRRVVLLSRVLRLLVALKLLLPDSKPKTSDQARMKVKMTLYMVSTALSQLNKAGDPDMVKWTSKQPERIYQWSCEPEGIAAYLKVKAGKSKAGRGYYTRRKPFVHMKFNGIEGALPVLSNTVDTVEAMAQGLLELEGSPEYGARLGDFMLRVAALVT
ncbi:MAG: hypothetical protein JXR94_18330 [Candidatus Hydrogenedentes bacterium]|nr:hypothetical protein [Candidatus Hydrogenedentota bacterium]